MHQFSCAWLRKRASTTCIDEQTNKYLTNCWYDNTISDDNNQCYCTPSCAWGFWQEFEIEAKLNIAIFAEVFALNGDDIREDCSTIERKTARRT